MSVEFQYAIADHFHGSSKPRMIVPLAGKCGVPWLGNDCSTDITGDIQRRGQATYMPWLGRGDMNMKFKSFIKNLPKACSMEELC